MKNEQMVPARMQDVFTEITRLTDDFCREYLNDEYAQVCRKMTAVLCRKRPSPLEQGKPLTWAAGIVYTVGGINFLYDKSQTPYMSPKELARRFGVGQSTLTAKKQELVLKLKLMPFHPDYTLPSRMADNPLVWMVEINGLIMDVRTMPREIQEAAFKKGLIPFIPGLREKKELPEEPKVLKFPAPKTPPAKTDKEPAPEKKEPGLFDELED